MGSLRPNSTVVAPAAAQAIREKISQLGIPAWNLGVIESSPRDSELPGYVREAKGVLGGAVRLVGNYGE